MWKIIILTFGGNFNFLRLLVLPKKLNMFCQNMVLHKTHFFNYSSGRFRKFL